MRFNSSHLVAIILFAVSTVASLLVYVTSGLWQAFFGWWAIGLLIVGWIFYIIGIVQIIRDWRRLQE